MDPRTAPHPVVVIGATGVLGRHLALAFADHHPVALVVRTPARLDPVLAQLPVAVADVRDGDGILRALVHHAESTGGLAGVVNAAGVVAFGGFGTLEPAVVDTLFATNAAGVAHVLAAATETVVEGGFVVNLSGVAAQMDLANLGAYCASKAAASAAMRVANREWRRHGIRSIDVRVGHCETGLSDRALAGVAPAFGAGHDPAAVAARIVRGVLDGERDLPPEAFADC